MELSSLEIDDLLDEVVTLKDRLLKIKRDKIDYSELSETEKKIVDTLKMDQFTVIL